jgi:hypothetical protein
VQDLIKKGELSRTIANVAAKLEYATKNYKCCYSRLIVTNLQIGDAAPALAQVRDEPSAVSSTGYRLLTYLQGPMARNSISTVTAVKFRTQIVHDGG